MGTTSEKLTYLNTTKGLIKDTINLTGANILSTDTFRSYATKLKNAYVDIINNGIDTLYDNFPKVTAEGTEIVLNNTYEAPIKLNVVKGDTQQDSYLGNQLIDFSNATGTTTNTSYSFTNNVYTITATSGTYTNVRYECTDLIKNNSGKTVRFVYNTIDTSNQYGSIAQLMVEYNDGTATLYKTLLNHTLGSTDYTIPNDTSNIEKVSFRIYSNNTNTNQSASITITKPMLQFGTETKTYEPYVGGKPSPNPDYPQNINVVTGLQNVSVSDGTNTTNYEVNLGTLELCKINDYQDTLQKSTGKNLFDKDNANTLNSYINDVSGAILSSTKSRTIYIPCKSNATYTISKQYETARFVVGTTTEIPTNNVVCTQTIIDSTATSITITTGANDKYLCAFIYHSDNDSPKTLDDILKIIQIELNSTSTPYEPYGKVWYKKASIGKVVLDGSESYSTGTQSGYYYFYKVRPTDSKPSTTCLSNYFNYNQSYTNYDNSIYIGNTNVIISRIKVNNSYIESDSDFQTWLNTHNTTIYYPLSTPTYTEITDTTLINQLESIKSKEDSTNITITGNLPMIINASALEKE